MHGGWAPNCNEPDVAPRSTVSGTSEIHSLAHAFWAPTSAHGHALTHRPEGEQLHGISAVEMQR